MNKEEKIKRALWTTIFVLAAELSIKELADFLGEETTLGPDVIEYLVGQIEEMREALKVI
jgi:hypothetical protein